MGIVENPGFGIRNAFIYLNEIYNIGKFYKDIIFLFLLIKRDIINKSD